MNNPTQADESKALEVARKALGPYYADLECEPEQVEAMAECFRHYTSDLRTQLAERDAQLAALRAYIEPLAALDGDEPERWLKQQGFGDWMELPKFVEEARRVLEATRQPTQDKE